MLFPSVETMEIRWQDMPQLCGITGVSREGVTADRIPHVLLKQNQLLLEKCAKSGELRTFQPQGVDQKLRKAERRCQVLKDMLDAHRCCPHERLTCVEDMLMVWEWENMCLQERDRQMMPPPVAPARGTHGNRSGSNGIRSMGQDGIRQLHLSFPFVLSLQLSSSKSTGLDWYRFIPSQALPRAHYQRNSLRQ